jgi:ribosome-binding protein aMBF1 (putative translation factor)
MLDDLFLMASQSSKDLVEKVIAVLQEERERQSLSLRALAAKGNLDVTLLSRCERKERIAGFAFFLDWSSALGITIEDAVKEARKR